MVHHPNQHLDSTPKLRFERDILFSTSLKMEEYDVLGQSTTWIEQFLWHIDAYFQIDAFVFILSFIEPLGTLVDRAWDLISETYKYHTQLLDYRTKYLYVAIGDLTLHAWELRQAANATQNLDLTSFFYSDIAVTKGPKYASTFALYWVQGAGRKFRASVWCQTRYIWYKRQSDPIGID